MLQKKLSKTFLSCSPPNASFYPVSVLSNSLITANTAFILHETQ